MIILFLAMDSKNTETGLLILECMLEHKMLYAFRKTVWQFLIKLHMCIMHDLAIVLLGIYLTESKI